MRFGKEKEIWMVLGKKGKKGKRKKRKRVTLHHRAGKFCQANSQPELIWLYSQQTCSNAITVSLHCL